MIYIPNKLKVGFQNRSGTYTGRLAYIIYYDPKGKLRKEPSWNNWRSKDIEPEEYTNEPTSGFVLNKKVGGYATHYDARQTYVRVYDPRGFEFEITVPNLLFILENTNSIKGKGLEGEFVYGWDGTELVLIPVGSPDYVKHIEKSNKLNDGAYFLEPKELKVGYRYKIKSQYFCDEIIFMGKFKEYDSYGEAKSGKKFFFFWDAKEPYLGTFTSMKDRILECLSESPDERYPELLEQMERNTMFSPIDESKNEYEPITLDEFKGSYGAATGWARKDLIYGEQGERYRIYVNSQYPYTIQHVSIYDDKRYKRPYWGSYMPNGYCILYAKSWEEAHEHIKPQRTKRYLANGKLYEEGIFFE